MSHETEEEDLLESKFQCRNVVALLHDGRGGRNKKTTTSSFLVHHQQKLLLLLKQSAAAAAHEPRLRLPHVAMEKPLRDTQQQTSPVAAILVARDFCPVYHNLILPFENAAKNDDLERWISADVAG